MKNIFANVIAKENRKWAIAIIVITVFAAFAIILLGMARSGLPKTEGAIKVPGFSGNVEIIRGEGGLTHILGRSEEELFFAQGYAHAQDRMYQMELLRRTIAGRLSEVVGEGAIASDTYFRTIELYKLAVSSYAHSDERTKKNYEAYARGVNAWLDEKPSLPPEFLVLGQEIEPWTPEDSLAAVKSLTYALASGSSYTEVLRTSSLLQYGAELTEKRYPTYHVDETRILNEQEVRPEHLNGESYKEQLPTILENHELIKDELKDLDSEALAKIAMIEDSPMERLKDLGIEPGSNNWVVSGKFTESGKPILCNDPHMGASIPLVFYFNELKGETLNISGVTVPGVPGVVIGRNQDISWGVTNFWGDVQDYYAEIIKDDRYLFQGEWYDLDIQEEEILVKGADPVKLKIRKTNHGPIMNDVLEIPGVEIALKWTILKKDDISHIGVMDLLYASSWNEFKSAFDKISAPIQNWVYADTKGNIGYLAFGDLPVRSKGNGNTIVPGWTGEWEWEGFVPYEEMPQVFNPEKGYIVTANNYSFPDEHQTYLGCASAYDFTSRATRITEYIEAKIAEGIPINKDHMAQLQQDELSNSKFLFVQEAVKRISFSSKDKKTIELLSHWDGITNKESVETTIVHYWLNSLSQLVDFDGSSDYSIFYPTSAIHTLPYRFISELENGEEAYFDDKKTTEVESVEEILLESLDMAIDTIKQNYGDNMTDWQWGKVHHVKFSHPIFGSIPLLKGLFNRSVESGGSFDTVNFTAPMFTPDMNTQMVPTARFITDLGQENGNYFIMPTGQSAHFLSPYYDNLNGKYFDGGYINFSISDREISGKRLLLGAQAE